MTSHGLKAAQLCAECGKDHPGDCIAETKYCVNCKHSGHGSKDPNCPILKRENAIIVLRKQHKIGYLRAREVYNKMHRNSTNLGQRHSIERNRTEFRRKQPNIVQASQNKIPNYTPNSLVGQSWLQPKTVQASKVGNTIKSQGGPKYFPNKTNKTSFKHQPPSLDGGNTNALSPQIHNSQIAGSSKMDTPWIAPKTKKTKQKNKNTQKKYCKTAETTVEPPIELHNQFEILDSDVESDGEINYPPNKSPAPIKNQNKKRPTSPSPINPSCKKQRVKITPKPKTVEVKTSQPSFKNDIGTKKPKTCKVNTKNKDSVEKSTVGVDFENIEDILKHLGQHIDLSSNLMFIVKLLGALISKISMDTMNETKLIQLLTSSKDVENIRPE